MRRVLVITLVAVLVLCGGGTALAGWMWSRTAISTVGDVDFTRPLAIPPLAASHVDEQGRRVFDLRAAAGTTDFGRGGPTRTWGYSGGYLGPTLRASRGEKVLINVHNGLDEETTVHWHGMHLPASMDGGPHQPIRPDATWSPTWTIDQPAATLWYHPHPHGETEFHVYRGLAGMFILDDPAASALPLPHWYGVDDIPLIVQDKRFDGAQFGERSSVLGSLGILGDTVLVNGTVGPYLDVSTERVRLRILNASNARTFNFGLADDRSFAIVATDGGLLPAPVVERRVQLAPGERAEIILTVRPHERVVLRGYPADLGTNFIMERLSGGDDTFDVLEVRAAATLRPSADVPSSLVDVPRIDPVESVRTRFFDLADESINGAEMSMRRVDAVVTKDTVETWEIRNRDGFPHTFHVHDVQFQVLSIDGDQPPLYLRGWKDTVYAVPNAAVRIIARFTDYADPQSPYMFHCHMLRHEDGGMMGQFVVVEPGQRVHVHGD